jgi:hypothetical protein
MSFCAEWYTVEEYHHCRHQGLGPFDPVRSSLRSMQRNWWRPVDLIPLGIIRQRFLYNLYQQMHSHTVTKHGNLTGCLKNTCKHICITLELKHD